MELRVHLKVCEGCGCLWYRPDLLGASTYCRDCQTRLKDFPVITERPRRRPRRRFDLYYPPLIALAVTEPCGGAQ